MFVITPFVFPSSRMAASTLPPTLRAFYRTSRVNNSASAAYTTQPCSTLARVVRAGTRARRTRAQSKLLSSCWRAGASARTLDIRAPSPRPSAGAASRDAGPPAATLAAEGNIKELGRAFSPAVALVVRTSSTPRSESGKGVSSRRWRRVLALDCRLGERLGSVALGQTIAQHAPSAVRPGFRALRVPARCKIVIAGASTGRAHARCQFALKVSSTGVLVQPQIPIAMPRVSKGKVYHSRCTRCPALSPSRQSCPWNLVSAQARHRPHPSRRPLLAQSASCYRGPESAMPRGTISLFPMQRYLENIA
ncbi:hypothetical protein AURDEDRAFT_165791 [Auricularia subglabra TFB-10046 SS5]|nr:hypothetical protein AURDEDRAFT_165791 [Auricularia subglabra TFB-10046 SS5]